MTETLVDNNSSLDSSMDVVVVGAGISGMLAAIRVAQDGRRAVVLEKLSEDRYVCNSRLTQGVWHCALTDVMSDAQVLERRILDVTAGSARPDLAKAVAGDALRVVRWMQELGVRFIKGPLDYQSFVLAPPSVTANGREWQGRGGDVMLRTLESALKAHGGELRRGHRAQQLIVEGGRIAGVSGEADGRLFRLRANAIVIADGGFQSNDDLTRQFSFPHPDAVFQRNAGTGMGDGLKMAIEAGAATTDLEAFYGHILSKDAFTNENLAPYPFLDFVMSSAMLVDRDGLRWVDEGKGGIAVANAIAQSDDPGGKIIIADENIWNDSGRFRLLSPNPWLSRAGGTIHRANSIAQLAGLCSIDAAALAASVAQYNDAVRAGTATTLSPPRSVDTYAAKPVETSPFYAIPVCAGITYTMGGIAIDANARVLTPEQSPIPGLYAVGCAAGGIEGGPAIGYVGGLLKSSVTGLRAGEHILSRLECL